MRKGYADGAPDRHITASIGTKPNRPKRASDDPNGGLLTELAKAKGRNPPPSTNILERR
jgi:hypothetical protein